MARQRQRWLLVAALEAVLVVAAMLWLLVDVLEDAPAPTAPITKSLPNLSLLKFACAR